MSLSVVGICLAVVIGWYFLNNPLRHGGWFLVRRFINWFPLGMTYAFLYMERYNLNVAKNALGALMSNEGFGLIVGFGTGVYAFSFLINGPLVDRIGGKKGILIAAVGSAFANIALGVATWLATTHRLRFSVVWVYSVLYALNMYFQSYGAVSIIKVKAYWFHVRERGVFGAIFGTLISFGVYFAFDWGQGIVEATRAGSGGGPSWVGGLLADVFAAKSATTDATWAVFFVPAAAVLFWAVLDAWLIKDTPEEAGFPAFDTADASSGQMHVRLSAWGLLKKVCCSPLMLMVATVEFTSGIFRNGVTQWYFVFAQEVRQPGAEFFLHNWGLWICVGGIVGAFAGGLVSDKLFQSRRGPPAGMLCGLVLLFSLVMAACLFSSPIVVGASGVIIVAASVGITSLMSGTAATDFGGRTATATASGIVDGFAYLGSSVQSFSLGYLTTLSWRWMPLFLVPFAVIGLAIAIKIWWELPAATKQYNAEVALKHELPAAA